VSDRGQQAGIRARVLTGLAWKVFSQTIRQGSRIVVAIILARLLAPHDYGLAAMVLVFSTLGFIFSDLALGAALVQRQKLSDADRSTMFWTSAAAGTGCMLVGIALSGPIATFYGEPAVRTLFAALSVGFLITSLGTTQRAVLERELDFRSLELRQIAATLVGAAIGIGIAIGGGGAWAIVAQQLAMAVVSTVLLWIACPWRPRFAYSVASLRDLGGFSGNVFATRLLFYTSRNLEKLLIGRFLGPVSLGAYAIAYNLMLVPLERVAAPIQEVLFPAFSRMQDDVRRVGMLWLRANRFVAAVTLPVMLGLIVVAPDFVVVVLGSKWEAATTVIQILAWVGLLQSLVRLNSSVLQARDRTDILLRWSLLITAANAVAFVVGLQWGIVGVAAAYALTNTLLQPFNTWLTARAVEMSLREFVAGLAGIAQAAAVVPMTVLPLRLALVEQEVPAAARLPILIAAGAVAFLAVCAWRAPEVLAELRALRARDARTRRPEIGGLAAEARPTV
jgi:O-antigen/teichoic acid export membrane protein